MHDGRSAQQNPNAILNDQVMQREKIMSNAEYRDYLQKNADVIINILTYDPSDNTASLRETHTTNMIDGSLNLSNISINTTGFNYFIEI